MTIHGMDQMDNTWKPKLIIGGKDGGIMLPNPDWLWELNLHDVFFCKPSKQPIFLQIFVITAKLEQNGNRLMRLENPEVEGQHLTVDTREFSKEFKFHMLVNGVTEDGPSGAVDGSRLDGDAPS